MKLIRTISLAFAFLIPAAALASPTVRAAACPMGCCEDGHCPMHCPNCNH